jgi:soluble lytic murein transglycosylase
MRFLLCLILLFTCCSPVYVGEVDSKAFLKKGKDELETGKYEDAILNLSKAERDFPLLGDYALLWLSDAYHEIGDHKESLRIIHTLPSKYPLSPLIKKSRIREIKEAEEVSEDNIQQMFESYIKDYPDDMEIKYLYAQWLKKNGNRDMSKSVFKEIYLDAGPFSTMALSELSSSDISAEDLINKAAKLMSMRDFRQAESVLRAAIAKDDGRLKNKILKNLGRSLFKQRKYSKAAEVYKDADEKYWQVRSLYRAGKKEAFNSALKKLLKSGDKRAGIILVSIASDKRREGNIEEAVEMYQNVIERFPSETEDALWGVGWTYFLTGKYKNAAKIFTRLYDTYSDTKYLYWKTRSLEECGEDVLNIYCEIMGKGRDFYGILSYIKVNNSPEKSRAIEVQKFLGITKPVRDVPVAFSKNERIEALLDLGLSREALSELIYISKHPNSKEALLYICSKLQELEEYNYSVRLALKLPYIQELHQFRYPFAYRDIVEGLSGRYNLDPLLVVSVAREESRFDPLARSIAGALGLMQIMPHTAYRVDKNLKLGINSSHELLDIKNNLHFGIYILSNLFKEFGSYSYALASYNAGEDKVREWLQKGNYKSVDEFIEDIPYNETRNYVKSVVTTFFEYKRISSLEENKLEFSLEKL